MHEWYWKLWKNTNEDFWMAGWCSLRTNTYHSEIIQHNYEGCERRVVASSKLRSHPWHFHSIYQICFFGCITLWCTTAPSQAVLHVPQNSINNDPDLHVWLPALFHAPHNVNIINIVTNHNKFGLHTMVTLACWVANSFQWQQQQWKALPNCHSHRLKICPTD
jgi:hypothetical protein